MGDILRLASSIAGSTVTSMTKGAMTAAATTAWPRRRHRAVGTRLDGAGLASSRIRARRQWIEADPRSSRSATRPAAGGLFVTARFVIAIGLAAAVVPQSSFAGPIPVTIASGPIEGAESMEGAESVEGVESVRWDGPQATAERTAVDRTLVEREVEAMLATGELPANMRELPRETLHAFVRRLDERTFLETQDYARQLQGMIALGGLLAQSGPLPGGMPPGTMHAITQCIAPGANPSARGVEERVFGIAILADGSDLVSRRLAELPASAGETYGLLLARSMGARLVKRGEGGAAPTTVPALAGWSDEQLSKSIAALASWIEDGVAETTDAEALPKNVEEGVSGVAGQMAVIGMLAEKHPKVRLEAALASVRAFDALDAAYERLGSPSVRSGLGSWPFLAVLAAASGASVTSRDLTQLAKVASAFDAVTTIADDRIEARMLAAWIPTLELVTSFLCRVRPETVKVIDPGDVLPDFFQSCTALVARLAGLPVDHPAWDGANRTAWVRAVDRFGVEKSCAASDDLSSAWRAARALLPAEWRAEAVANAESEVKAREVRRLERQRLREAWDLSIKSGAFLRPAPPVEGSVEGSTVAPDQRSDAHADELSDEKSKAAPATAPAPR
ncbi:MAG: hypothetical protein RL591_1078 [Planctomycetota bacterium]|jgi:hypothetical protein